MTSAKDHLGEEAEKRRSIMRAVMKRFDLSQKRWCDKAGIENSGALGNFLANNPRSPKSLNVDTLKPLAESVGLTVSHLLGEVPLPWERSKNSDKPAANLQHEPGTAEPSAAVEITIKGPDFSYTQRISARMVPRLINTILADATEPTADR